jgi:hypothetical protein
MVFNLLLQVLIRLAIEVPQNKHIEHENLLSWFVRGFALVCLGAHAFKNQAK